MNPFWFAFLGVEPQRGCESQPRVAANAATLGRRLAMEKINPKGVAPYVIGKGRNLGLKDGAPLGLWQPSRRGCDGKLNWEKGPNDAVT